jgi:hypothetical protein
MDVIRAPPYSYQFRELVVVRAKAYNVYGWALTYSPDNTTGATTRTEPAKMGPISVDAFETNINQVSVFWAPQTTGVE